ncbi:MAG: Hsp70 family protein [bacterium]
MATFKRAVGIDLGTTNSAIAMLSPTGEDVVLWQDRFKRKTFPSLVGWDDGKQDWVTGWEAWNRRGLDPQPIASVKRKMGSGQKLEIADHTLTPAEVSGRILEAICAGSRASFEPQVAGHSTVFDAAVITVPAYFDAPQIEETRRAGELANLRVLSLLQEPTAAAMYHAWKHGIEDGVFLVYDLGGGTFDVSVIRSIHGEYQVLGIDGDNFLGGDDFDRRLAEHFRGVLVEQGYALDLDLNVSADAARFTLLMRVAQEVKEALSTSEVQYVGRRDLLIDQAGNPVTLELEYSRVEFEALIQDLVEQTLTCCHGAISRAVQQAQVGADAIDHILMVGGSTRVPLVREAVKREFCHGQTRATDLRVDEPDTCVALGAALRASTLGGLEIVEDAMTVVIRSSTYTHEDEVDISGTVFDERIKTAALINQAGDVASVVRTSKRDDISFEFEGVRLPDVGTYAFTIDFSDADGEPVVTVPLFMHRGDPSANRPTGSALSSPSVLAKDIMLEVVRDGRSELQPLLVTGTSLPADGEFRFFTADRSGAVILRLYQSRFPIRAIHLALPEGTPTGTPVHLRVQVDESMAMVAEGEVAGQKFWAQIEPPPPRELKDWSEIEELLAEVERVATQLWGRELNHYRAATEALVAGIRETVRTDPDKLQALVSRLETVMDSYRNRESHLTPAWHRFELLLNAVKRVVFRGDGQRQLGLSTQEWQAKLTDIESQGREAYDRLDQATWTSVFNQIQAIWESLAQDEFRFAAASDPASHVRTLAATLSEVIDDLRSSIHGFALSPNPETAELQQVELRKLEFQLAEKLEGPFSELDIENTALTRLKPELDRLFEISAHLRRQFDRLPTLGLVSR